MAKGNDLCWAVFRIVVYTAAIACGFGMAGIIGTTKVQTETGHHGCLLSASVSKLHSVEACRQEQCKINGTSCKEHGYHCTRLPGDKNTYCYPDTCYESKHLGDLSTCKYVIYFGCISGASALISALFNIYKLKASKTSASALQASTLMTVMIAVFSCGMVGASVACGGMLTNSFNTICKSFKTFPAPYNSCAQGYKFLHYNGDGPRVFPDFYFNLFVAMIMAWITCLAWILNAAGAFYRCCDKSKKKKTTLDVQGEDDDPMLETNALLRN